LTVDKFIFFNNGAFHALINIFNHSTFKLTKRQKELPFGTLWQNIYLLRSIPGEKSPFNFKLYPSQEYGRTSTHQKNPEELAAYLELISLTNNLKQMSERFDNTQIEETLDQSVACFSDIFHKRRLDLKFLATVFLLSTFHYK